MAFSFHVRSNSLPSRPHPVISELDEHMRRLRDSQAGSTFSSSLDNNLASLQDLHDCADKLLLLPLTQQVLAQEHNRKKVDELLDGSLRLLDLCNITKDALSQNKDCIQQLQSVFRRKQGSVDSEIKKYISSRKTVKKTIKKASKNLKSNANKSVSSADDILAMMREVETITLSTFESFLSYISEPSKPSGWSIVSKLMHHKRVAAFSDEQEANQSEFATVDTVLQSLIGSKTVKSEEVQKKLHSLELCIQDLEDGIECLFRKMIKSRASFLNIFN